MCFVFIYRVKRLFMYSTVFLLRYVHVLSIEGRCGTVGRASEMISDSCEFKPNKFYGIGCFLEQETLPSLLGIGWFQELIRAWLHNQTKVQ